VRTNNYAWRGPLVGSGPGLTARQINNLCFPSQNQTLRRGGDSLRIQSARSKWNFEHDAHQLRAFDSVPTTRFGLVTISDDPMTPAQRKHYVFPPLKDGGSCSRDMALGSGCLALVSIYLLSSLGRSGSIAAPLKASQFALSHSASFASHIPSDSHFRGRFPLIALS
jgi:hypothetical protein